ncbi:MAG: hypothetical protein LBT40_17650, partial [Deltaproteobacteria bacterium]|nr:hypothetical protein [Deltaproteobacteria bacterium]
MTSNPTSEAEILGRTLDALLDEAAGLCSAADEGGDWEARRRARASMTLLRARDAYERLDAAGVREGGERDFIKRGARLVASNASCGFTAEADTLYASLLARCEAFKRGDTRLDSLELYRALALSRAARRLAAAFQRQGLPEDADRIFFSMELLAHGEGALAEMAYCASYLVLESVQAQDRERSLRIFGLLRRVAVPPPRRPGPGHAWLTLVDGVPGNRAGEAEDGGGPDGVEDSGTGRDAERAFGVDETSAVGSGADGPDGAGASAVGQGADGPDGAGASAVGQGADGPDGAGASAAGLGAGGPDGDDGVSGGDPDDGGPG